MNMLASLRRPKVKPSINLEKFIEEQLGAIELTDEEPGYVALPTPVELAEQRVNQFIAEEEAQIYALLGRIEERDKLNQADRAEIAERKAAIAVYRGDQIKPKVRAK